jgi:hypothetical protein
MKLEGLMEYSQIPDYLKALAGLLVVLVFLTGIQVYLSAERNRLLSSIDRSLKMLPGVARNDRRVA